VPSLTQPVLAPGVLADRRQPVINGSGLRLRPWEPSDGPVLARAYSLPDIQRWHGRSLDAAEAARWITERADRWQAETGADWAVEGERGVLGRIAFRWVVLADGAAEISYWVLPEARGAGVATRALCALSAWALQDLGLHRLELMHAAANPASGRVAVQAGYSFEGTKRREGLHPDGWHDMRSYARLADDPAPRTPPA
jgi:RimJ/RimL family protein N-acetyltransferase